MLARVIDRSAFARLAAAALLLSVASASVAAAAGEASVASAAGEATVDAGAEHPVVGRYAITSEAGGAVWAFQAGGALILLGPGDIVSEGSWTPAAGEREFDASVDVTVSGQRLEVLGELSPDGSAVAVYVAASEPQRPEDWTPWPAESRLTGERVGMTPEPAPSATPRPADCARPDWIGGAVDWDRCDGALLTDT